MSPCVTLPARNHIGLFLRDWRCQRASVQPIDELPGNGDGVAEGVVLQGAVGVPLD